MCVKLELAVGVSEVEWRVLGVAKMGTLEVVSEPTINVENRMGYMLNHV